MTAHCHGGGGGGPCSLAGPSAACCVFCLSGPARASICIWCISLNQTPTDAVACRISVLGLVFYSLRPLVLVSDPTVGFSPLASSCPPTAQPLVVLGVTVMDPHTFSLSLSRPSHPIPSCPSPWWSWWFAAFLARSAFCCLLPRAGPLSPSPSNPSHPPLARPSEQLDVPIPTLSLSFLFRSSSHPPTLMGSLGLTPPSLPSSPRASSPSSPVTL